MYFVYICVISSYLAADIVAECHVRVQDVRVKELKVCELWSKKAALQEVHVGHIWDVPNPPGDHDSA